MKTVRNNVLKISEDIFDSLYNDVIDYSGYSQLDATYNNLSESDDEFGEYVSITDNRVEDFPNTNNNMKNQF